MITQEQIEEVKTRLVKEYNPVAIYLFGSYAWGSPTEDSDLDLLIIVDESTEKSFVRPVRGYRALRGMDLAKDILVFTKQEFDLRSSNITTLSYKIKKDGELLYARA